MEKINNYFNSLKIDVLSLEKIKTLNEFDECLNELENEVYFYMRQCCDDYVKKNVLSLFKDIKYSKTDDFNYMLLYKNSIIGRLNPLYKKVIIFNHIINKEIFDKNYSLLLSQKYEHIEKQKEYIKELENKLTQTSLSTFFELFLYSIKRRNFLPLKNFNQIKPNIMNTILKLREDVIKESNLLERIKLKKEKFFKEALTSTKDFIIHCENLGLKISYKNIDSLNTFNIIEDYINKYCVFD